MLRKLIIALCLFSITYSAMAGQPDSPPSASDHWHFIAAPYGWIFGMKGFMTVMGNRTNLDVSPIDVLKNIDKIDAIFQLHLEAQKARWALLLDSTYLKLTTNVGIGPIGAALTTSLAVVDFGAYYSIAPWLHMPSCMDMQLFGGGRYLYMNATIRPNRLPNIAGDQAFIAPIIGSRVFFNVSDKYQFILMGNLGGFGVDDANFTWSAGALFNILLKQYLALALGYRMEGFDYARGAGANHFVLHTTFYGPVMGLVFTFK